MTTGDKFYQNLALPAFGETQLTQITAATDIFTITGAASQSGDFFVCESSAGTECFALQSDGVIDITVSKTAADNAVALTLADASTLTTGYVQGFYASVTTSGSYSTGNTQINAFAVDLFLGGTVACEAEGMYIYVAKSGTPTITSANINGLNVYIDDLGASPSTRAAIQLHMAGSNAASSQDAFIVMRVEGASPTVTNMFQKSGTAANPTYLLATNATDGMVGAATLGGTQDKFFAVNINGSDYCIALYQAT